MTVGYGRKTGLVGANVNLEKHPHALEEVERKENEWKCCK